MSWMRDTSGLRIEEQLPDAIDQLLSEVATDLDTYWGSGAVSPSAYETAWVAMVRDPLHPQQLAFPESLDWLVKTQRQNGSWEGTFPYTILPALAGLLAVAKAPQQTPAIAEAQKRAEYYLRQTLPHWDIETFDTPLFEFLVPVLGCGLAQLGIQLPIPQLDLMEQRSRQKLQRVPLDLLYSGTSNLLHGLEALTAVLDFERLPAVQSPNGGYGNSPSATAAVLMAAPSWDAKAARWLSYLSSHAFGNQHGAMPTSHPADAFEVGWVIHLLSHSGVRFNHRINKTQQMLFSWLQACLTTNGASYARTAGLPCDADDTAVALAVLNRAGLDMPLDTLWPFEKDDHFVSYIGERTSSISANAHVLEALLSVPIVASQQRDLFVQRRRAAENITRYLFAERKSDGFWGDKWHLSAYYATLSSVLALTQTTDYGVHQDLLPTFDWLLHSQREDGGWGMTSSTAEETAYAVLALRALHHVLPFSEPKQSQLAIERGQRLLYEVFEREDDEMFPVFWVDKSMYAPVRVIRAAILAALHVPTAKLSQVSSRMRK